MNFLHMFFILTLISVTAISCSELKLVQVLCRHGDRTPTPDYREWYPTDPYVNENYFPPGFGELTREGRDRSYELGQSVRSRYFARLKMPSEYFGSMFKIISSAVGRCQDSAKVLLSALFPDNESIPVHHKPVHDDPLFLGIHICPIFRTEWARAQRSMTLSDEDEKWTPLAEYLSEHLGVNATRYHAFILLHTLMAQSSFGLSLPSWTKKIYPSEELEKNARHEYISQSYNTKMKRVNGGLWVHEFLKNIENVLNGTETAKMLIYVGHDVNVAGFLNALDIHQPRVPSFCSCVNLETYEHPENNQNYVKLLHKNYEKTEELQIPRCSSPCSLREFKMLTRHLIPRDFEKECGLNSIQNSSEFSSSH